MSHGFCRTMPIGICNRSDVASSNGYIGAIMNPFQLRRWVHSHSHVAVVWAMARIVLLNGRTLTGCGCTGHFEAVCHCGCAHACGSCCGQNGVRSCCAGNAADDLLANAATSADRSEHAQRHHCIQIAEYVVVPATISPTVDVDNSQVATLTLVAIDLAVVNQPIHPGQTSLWDTGPPNDIVVSFHRLVI